MTRSPVVRRSDVEIVDAVQSHFLNVFLPLERPAVEHAVELPGVVEELRAQLLRHRVSAPTSSCLRRRCMRLQRPKDALDKKCSPAISRER